MFQGKRLKAKTKTLVDWLSKIVYKWRSKVRTKTIKKPRSIILEWIKRKKMAKDIDRVKLQNVT